MGQCLKYLIIALLAVVLHNSVAKTVSTATPTPPPSSIEQCTLNQASTTQQAIQNFYNHLPSLSVCLNHTHTTFLFESKCMQLLIKHFCLQHITHTHQFNALMAYAPWNQLRPRDYYVVGLRKILV
ncbi:MAG: hypothetical protein Q4D56_02540 [Bacteroides sp.]|nr:hypothetical protein [Bacteroides sp.]